MLPENTGLFSLFPYCKSSRNTKPYIWDTLGYYLGWIISELGHRVCHPSQQISCNWEKKIIHKELKMSLSKLGTWQRVDVSIHWVGDVKEGGKEIFERLWFRASKSTVKYHLHNKLFENTAASSPGVIRSTAWPLIIRMTFWSSVCLWQKGTACDVYACDVYPVCFCLKVKTLIQVNTAKT